MTGYFIYKRWNITYSFNHGLLFLISLVSIASADRCTYDDGGWQIKSGSLFPEDLKCNINIRDGTLTEDEFLSLYAYDVPVILKNVSHNELFTKHCTRHNLLTNYGNFTIRLSSANSYSYDKVDVTLGYYLDKMMNSMKDPRYGNETFYFFGDVLPEHLEDLMEFYVPPPYTVPNTRPTLSFGIAEEGTGVPFHFHGPGFSEVIYGRKHWFLYPPRRKPEFHPNETSLHWFLNEYTKLEQDDIPYECTIGPGEVIYFPDLWWHSTLNLDTSVFITTFLGPP